MMKAPEGNEVSKEQKEKLTGIDTDLDGKFQTLEEAVKQEEKNAKGGSKK